MNQVRQYFAVTTPEDINPIFDLRYKNILVSFAYFKGSMREHILKNEYYLDNILMDSGAFTFWNSGNHDPKVMYDYMDMLKRDNIKKYIAFDKVFDPEESKKNYIIMRENDLDPIPCFHINTDLEYLDYYLDQSDHIAIGGMVGAKNVDPQLLQIWNFILNKKPEARVHGLGVSNLDTIIKYPWDSVDSSSHCSITKFARANRWVGKRFHPEDTLDYFSNKMGIVFPKEGSTGGMRYFLVHWQMEQYNRMIDYANEIRAKKDFSNLKHQQTLF